MTAIVARAHLIPGEQSTQALTFTPKVLPSEAADPDAEQVNDDLFGHILSSADLLHNVTVMREWRVSYRKEHSEDVRVFKFSRRLQQKLNHMPETAAKLGEAKRHLTLDEMFARSDKSAAKRSATWKRRHPKKVADP